MVGLTALSCGSEPAHSQLSDTKATDQSPIAAASAWLVSIKVTPGKPGAPTERVTIKHTPDKETIEVDRVSADQKILAQGVADLSVEAMTKVAYLITEHKLDQFEPRATDEEVFDFGVRRLHIEVERDAGLDPKVHDVEWERPLENDEDVAPLIDELASLAKEAVKNVHLAYLRPKPAE